MKEKKIKVLFIIPSLRAGGAERVISYLFNNVNQERFDCKLIVVGYEKEKVYELERPNVLFLNKKRVLYSFFPLFKEFLKFKPEIVFSAIAHLNIMMGMQSIFFPKIKFIAREVTVRSVSAEIYAKGAGKKLIPGMISKIGYRLLDKVVCQSKDMADDLINNFNFPRSKLIIINNPIPINLKTKSRIKDDKKGVYNLITIGRLVKLKGHERILEALSRIEIPFEYTIIGDGPELDNLITQIKRLGFSSRVKLIKYTDKINENLADSHLFLQGSYVEGFPNALLESCAVGTPAVVFNCPGGTNEIIQEGINGFKAENINSYAEYITLILKQIEEWKPSVVAASVYEKFSSEKILTQYEELFDSTIKA